MVADRIGAGREVIQSTQTIRVDAAGLRVAVLFAFIRLNAVLSIVSENTTRGCRGLTTRTQHRDEDGEQAGEPSRVPRI